METQDSMPKMLIEAVRHFSDHDRCHEYTKSIKWPDGKVTCPKCDCDTVGEIKSRRMFQCKNKDCRKQFSVKVGTIFEDSPLGLDKWFVAAWSITNAKNGISSCELARALGVTQKTAWFMLHRIRLAMRTKSYNAIMGTIEADETFVGGRAKNMHAKKRKAIGRGWAGKEIVHGLLERGDDNKPSRVDLAIIQNTRRPTIQKRVRDRVQQGANVYTDNLASYTGLAPNYAHEFVDHAIEYVRGAVHTNGLENFWSLLKRTLRGTYVADDPQHLSSYLNEQAYRFNDLKKSDSQRFQTVMSQTTGRRFTYAELTGDAV